VVCLLALLLASCTESPIEPRLDSGGELQVRPRLVRTITEATVTLRAVAFDSAGRPVFTGPVRWSSLDAQILAVNDSGTVQALSPGWGRVVVRSVDTSQEDTAVVAVGLRFAHISAGADYGCGWMEDGTGYCWGSAGNWYRGVLGTGSPPAVYKPATPTPVTGGLHFSTIATGDLHTCAIAGGAVYCWGSTSYFALGVSCPLTSFANGGCHAPERVDLTGPWKRVAVSPADYLTTAASCASGPTGLACWGAGVVARPQGGCGGCSPRLLSADLVGPVALGSGHGCALDAGGSVFCWGENRYGQLGDEIPPQYCRTSDCQRSNAPIRAATGERFVDLVAGAVFTCGLTATGQAFCWGSYDRYPESVSAPGTTPVAVAGDLRFRKLDAGTGHVCGLTADGAIWCWGDAAWTGALGEPLLPYNDVLTDPRRIMPSLTFADVAAGDVFTCGVVTDGETVCIGSHSGLGQGTYSVQSTTPLPLAPPGPLPAFIVFEQ